MIRVLTLGLGDPIPTFIKNRLIHLDESGQIFLYVLMPANINENINLCNGVVLKEINTIGNILNIIYQILSHPCRAMKLWISIPKSSLRQKIYQFIYYNDLIKVDRIDVIHLQWVSMVQDFLWLKSYFEAPIISSVRGSQITILPTISKEKETQLRNSIQASDFIHAVSQSMADACIRFGANPAKVFLNYNGINIERFNIQNKMYRIDDKLHLVSIGNLMWRKGFLWQLMLIKTLRKSGIKVKLTIIGDGQDRQGLHYTILKLGLRDDVILEGCKQHDEIIKYLQSSDIYISTSAAEGFSNAVLEAVACGLPVVAFDCEGMNEVITDGYNGFIVPFGDIESMVEKIINLYNNRQLLENMGLKGALIVKEKFDYKIHVHKMVEFYKSVSSKNE